MKKFITAVFLLIFSGKVHAMSWIIPDPITYEWTIETATKSQIPKFSANDVTVSQLIDGLSDDMVFPLRIEALGIAKEKLENKVTIKREQIAWIEIVALIADEIEADIVITKGGVVLVPATLKVEKVEPDPDNLIVVPDNPFNQQNN
ncbi:MAG: hypothetical protein AAGJ81_14305 [Verrucomicrobiota bacterium]